MRKGGIIREALFAVALALVVLLEASVIYVGEDVLGVACFAMIIACLFCINLVRVGVDRIERLLSETRAGRREEGDGQAHRKL